mgnify:FL=1
MDTKTERLVKQNRPHSCKPSPESSAFADPHLILLNEKQAAAFLGLTDRTLQQRRYYSQPPAYIKLPGSNAVRYRLSELIAFVEAGEVPLE